MWLGLALLTLAQGELEPPFLGLGETREARISDEDARVESPRLRGYTDFVTKPPRAQRFQLRVEQPGPYTIELVARLFDAYLVLRDESGGVLAEDDDGLLNTHARLVYALEPGRGYLLDACALHGDRGPFELRLARGEPAPLAPEERAAAERADWERRLAELEAQSGPESAALANALVAWGQQLYLRGEHRAALAPWERALAIRARVAGPEHLDTARVLYNLGTLQRALGELDAARELCARALAIRERVLGPEHADTLACRISLALVLEEQGEFAAARAGLEQALEVRTRVLGPEQRDTVVTAGLLGQLLFEQGDRAAARPLLERALALHEKVLGPAHPDTATCLNNLAGLLEAEGELAAARPLYERALAIYEHAFGPEHELTATAVNNLAFLLQRENDGAGAERLYERALAALEQSVGPAHPRTALCLGNLAGLRHARGDLAGAQALRERALAIQEKTLGRAHPQTVDSLHGLARGFADGGDPAAARAHALAAVRGSLAHARGVLWSLSERERLLSLDRGERCLELLDSLAGPESAATGEGEAFELALAWRGLVSRTLLASRASLRARVPARAGEVLAELQSVQGSISRALYTVGPDRGTVDGGTPEGLAVRLRALGERRNALEVELQRLAGPTSERTLTLAELRASLAPGAAFLDFFVHARYEPGAGASGRWGEPRVTAWIVRAGHELRRFDLGPAAPIEAAAKAWLAELVGRRGLGALGGVGENGAERSDERLQALLWAPLAPALAGVTRVFVRPDPLLGSVPFEAIPLSDGRYLIEERDFVYVQTPLDLLEPEPPSRAAPISLLTVGGVDFKERAALAEPAREAAALAASATRGAAPRAGLNPFWGRLPHTEYEAQVVNDLFETAFTGAARLALAADAPTEERLKLELPRHATLHLATHGFFHPAGTVSMWDSARAHAEPEVGGEFDGSKPGEAARALVGQLPGLLCGLVCAGANTPAPAGRDDGLLTAEEVLWLDLSKVELVVLSACETALGERRSGEGMIGLRRAFGLAGAKTVVSSLWSVKDRSTSELMQSFYSNLWLKKQGRAEALRNAQLEMLARNRASEGDALPSTWGAFVLSGEWR